MPNIFTTDYDAISKDYAQKRQKPWKHFLNFVDNLQKEGVKTSEIESGIVCDFGCGTGRHTDFLSQKSDIYIGTDISYEMLLKAISNQEINEDSVTTDERKATDHVKTQWIQCDLTAVPIRESIIDNIFSIAVLHHIQTDYIRERALSELLRVMKEKGYYIFSVWGLGSGKNLQNLKKKTFYTKMCLKEHHSFQYLKSIQRIGPDHSEVIRLYRNDLIVPWSVSNVSIQEPTPQKLEESDKKRDKYTKNIMNKVPRVYHFYSNNEIYHISRHFQIIKCIKTSAESTGLNYFLICKKK